MYVHWKSLLGFGFVFWLSLCATDFLGESPLQKQASDLNLLYENAVMKEILEKKAQDEVKKTHKTSGWKFAMSLIFWNSFAFVFSILFCIAARTTALFLWRLYITYKNSYVLMGLQSKQLIVASERSSSRIPVWTLSKPTVSSRASDTNIKVKPIKINSESSCPNLQKDQNPAESPLQLKPICQMLFKNNLFAPAQKITGNFDRNWQFHCVKLREEIQKTQATSLKEHANLSRKLDAVFKEKKELSKLLAVAHKENRAAKQQLEELLEEKTILLKRLENATKEFRFNTKTKKVALAKLDEVTGNVESLKMQLEQVSRDKEILENKFKVLEVEYLKLQDRLMAIRCKNEIDIQDNAPERDHGLVFVDNATKVLEKSFCDNNDGDSYNYNDSSIPQAEMDMKKIEIKIKQLEKSLENFNTSLTGKMSFESDISSSVLDNLTDSQFKSDEHSETADGESGISTPRLISWTRKAGDTIQSHFHNNKVRFLETFTTQNKTLRENDENCEPQRIVSSSRAFQDFLRGLHSSDSSRMSYSKLI